MLTERTQVLLTPAQRHRLDRMAAERKISVGALIRLAIDAYVHTAGKSPEDAMAQLFSLDAPVGDWEDMKAEILSGATG